MHSHERLLVLVLCSVAGVTHGPLESQSVDVRTAQ